MAPLRNFPKFRSSRTTIAAVSPAYSLKYRLSFVAFEI